MTIRMWCKSHNKIAIMPILGKTLKHNLFNLFFYYIFSSRTTV